MRMPAVAIVSTALLLSGAAQAMEIEQFDKMAGQDQSEYIGNLIAGAENALIDENRSDLAAQINTLFTTKKIPVMQTSWVCWNLK